MKRKEQNKMLELNKQTVSNLEQREMSAVKGGSVFTLAVGPCATTTTTTDNDG